MSFTELHYLKTCLGCIQEAGEGTTGYRMRRWHSNASSGFLLIQGAEHGGHCPGTLAVQVPQCSAAPDLPGRNAAEGGERLESFQDRLPPTPPHAEPALVSPTTSPPHTSHEMGVEKDPPWTEVTSHVDQCFMTPELQEEKRRSNWRQHHRVGLGLWLWAGLKFGSTMERLAGS